MDLMKTSYDAHCYRVSYSPFEVVLKGPACEIAISKCLPVPMGLFM